MWPLLQLIPRLQTGTSRCQNKASFLRSDSGRYLARQSRAVEGWSCLQWHKIRTHEASEANASITRGLQSVKRVNVTKQIPVIWDPWINTSLLKRNGLYLTFHIFHDDSRQWCWFRMTHPEVGNLQTLLPAHRRKVRVSAVGSGSWPGRLPDPHRANAHQFYKEDGVWYA